jgi:hypothetical protein
MGGPLERAKRFYQPQLEPGETIKAVRRATAGGTGSKVGYGAVVGALLGWLYAINVDSALLPPLVLGALAGELGGYLLAQRAARRPGGPGAIHLEVVQTDLRLFTVRRHASLRRRILRSYRFADTSEWSLRPYPIGSYQRLEITLAHGATTVLVVEGTLDLPLNTDTSAG